MPGSINSISTDENIERTVPQRALSNLSNMSIDSEIIDNDSLLEEEEKYDADPNPLTREALDYHKRAIASIAPILEDFVPVLSKSEIVSPSQDALSRTVSNVSALSINHHQPSSALSSADDGEKRRSLSDERECSNTTLVIDANDKNINIHNDNNNNNSNNIDNNNNNNNNNIIDSTNNMNDSRKESIDNESDANINTTTNTNNENVTAPNIKASNSTKKSSPEISNDEKQPISTSSSKEEITSSRNLSSSESFSSSLKSRSLSNSSITEQYTGPKLPKIGTIGVCAMDNKVLSKPCRQILQRLIARDEFDTVIFGDKVILDEAVENWPTCDFLISFFSNGFPLEKAIAYEKLRKPYCLNDLVMQKALWDRRLCLEILKAAGVPTPYRLVISRDGGPQVDDELRKKLENLGINCDEVEESKWEMLDDDTLLVDGQIIKKPFVEKPVDGEDHNVNIYYSKKNGGGGRRLFRKIGNKSSEFDPNLNEIRTTGSYIYEQFIDTDNFEDVKAYTVGQDFCHAETRKSPVVDGIVRRNTQGKEVRYPTELSDEEVEIARKVTKYFEQTICGFDLLRTNGKSYVIDVNGFSFVKDNKDYYDTTASILRSKFLQAITIRNKNNLPIPVHEKSQKWVFKGFVSVIRHADRTPKQKFKYSFKSPIFISLMKGYKEEIIIREVRDLNVVLQTIKVAIEKKLEDAKKLKTLESALERKMTFPGTKIQLKPALNKETDEIEKVQLILKWGGEPTHSARYQATDVGEQFRQDIQLLNKAALDDVRVFTSSERRVVASAQLFSKSFLCEDELPDDFLKVRKDLLDDSNAAKDLMDQVKKKLKPLLRQGKEAPPQFAWPPKMPEPFIVIKRVVELMNYHHKIMDENFKTQDVDKFQEFWCCHEDPFLFKERWDKLFQEFVTVEKVHPSKISELYDTMKYDALHNREFLQKIFIRKDNGDNEEGITSDEETELAGSLMNQYPINILAMNDFKVNESSLDATSTSSAENSNNSNPAGSIGWVLSSSHLCSKHKSQGRQGKQSPFDDAKYNLLRELYRLAKVLFDFICPQEYGIEDNEKLDIGLLTTLPLAKQILKDITEIKETNKAGTRVYFTKESHIYTLLNILYESNVPMKIARNALPELDYLSQIVFELYESVSVTGHKKHSIRLSLSPGCHTQDPLDVELDDKHYISCIRRINLTRHLDMDLVQQKLKSRFSRVSLPKKFTPVNISSPLDDSKP
ncbi:inositol polyphosphate kinase [Pichia kluyveri]|uniref:Inositol hexakisphosphate and diphosphoinositol-pentakisphosphate kinase n=1 Tax=Pichia kluyveri TaxID=36015 RepID=A0AAV5R3J8_PICKL|nr:inositol polyphosphate kinase [Pichia kluyveri]